MKQITNKSYFNNIIMLSYITLLATIIIIGTVLYLVSYSQVKNGTHRQSLLSLSSSISMLDTSLEVMNTTARQISSVQSINNLSNLTDKEDSYFYYCGYLAQNSIRNITPLKGLLPISNFFVYFPKSNYVLSSTLFSDFDFYMKIRPKISDISKVYFSYLNNQKNWNRFSSVFSDIDDSLELIYLCPLSSGVVTNGNINAVICFEFGEKQLNKYFKEINLYDSGYLVAFNSNGDLMFHIGNQKQLIDYQILHSLDYKNHISYINSKFSNQEFLVTTALSDYNNWTYYLVQPKNQAYYSISLYQKIFVIITVIIFIIGGIITIFSSKTIRQNITNLINELTASKSLATTLNIQMEKQLPIVFESYTRRIMEGSITSHEEMQQIIKSMCLEQDHTAFHVLYTEVYPSEDVHMQTNDIDLCIQNYNTIVKETLRRYYPNTGYLYTPFNSVFAILLASDVNVPFDLVVSENKSAFKDLHNELLNNYGIFIIGGIGDQSYQISYVWKSYQQAKDVKSVTTKDNYILSTYDFTDSVDLYHYPESLSVQLSGFISTGNKSKVAEIFELINEENMVKRKLPYSQQHWLISDIRGTIFKKRCNISYDNLSPDKIRLLDLIDRQLEGEMSLSSLRKIANELCEVYGPVTKSNDLIVNIQSYINNNYIDSELSLTKISQEFGISENYFSYLFKKEASENFSSYLERLRMIRAKEMVLNHDNNLSEIYQHVGYNNAASFRRAFKKIFGVSPKEMRSKLNAK